MTFISINSLRKSHGHRLPSNVIIYRTIYRKNQSKNIIEILIPREIVNQVGIDIGSQIDVLYDPGLKKIKIIPLKNTNGINVSAISTYYLKKRLPIKKVRIQLKYEDDFKLPITYGKNIIIHKWSYEQGLNFSLED